MVERLTERQLRGFLKAAQSKRVAEVLQRALDEKYTNALGPTSDSPLCSEFNGALKKFRLKGQLEGLVLGFRIALGETDIQGPYSLVKRLRSAIERPLSRRSKDSGIRN